MKVNKATLEKVVAWCEQHKNDPEEATEDDPSIRKRTNDISEWDRCFMDVEQSVLFNILEVSFMPLLLQCYNLDRPPITLIFSPCLHLDVRHLQT